MGAKTKIDWCDATWNPVTGCLHGCEYCYARRIAERFGGCWRLDLPPDTSWRKIVVERGLMGDYARHSNGKCHVLDEPEIECGVFDPPGEYRGKVKPYPYSFDPTFHRYKLDEPQRWKKPRNIFVCSMADLFGEWVPDEWIKQVFRACEKAPQHRYLFLTKNPGRYCDLERAGIMPKGDKFWFGATFDHSNWNNEKIKGRPVTFSLNGRPVHDAGDYYYPKYPEKNRFVSFEPLLYDIGARIGSTGGNWLIIGAETGNRKGKIIPKREWVENIVEAAQITGMKVFMKESLRGLMGEDFRQEFPWEV